MRIQQNNLPSIAILGATGVVGIECLKLLAERNYPADKISLLASPRTFQWSCSQESRSPTSP